MCACIKMHCTAHLHSRRKSIGVQEWRNDYHTPTATNQLYAVARYLYAEHGPIEEARIKVSCDATVKCACFLTLLANGWLWSFLYVVSGRHVRQVVVCMQLDVIRMKQCTNGNRVVRYNRISIRSILAGRLSYFRFVWRLLVDCQFECLGLCSGVALVAFWVTSNHKYVENMHYRLSHSFRRLSKSTLYLDNCFFFIHIGSACHWNSSFVLLKLQLPNI